MIATLDNFLNFFPDIVQKKEVQALLKEVSLVSGYLWERGWAERNAGNFSVNISGYFTKKELDKLSSYPFFPLNKAYSGLARSLFMISGAGTRMRQMAQNPVAHLCFIYIDATGTAYHIIGGDKGDQTVKPTSELAAHLAIHQNLRQKKAVEKVVLHAHVTELIALTQLPGFDNRERLNQILLGMHPEALYFFPQGFGFVPYLLSGTEQLARQTVVALEKHRTLIWEKHGCLSVGTNFTETFDNLDLLAKLARIYFLCKSAGVEPTGLTEGQMAEIRNSMPIVL